MSGGAVSEQQFKLWSRIAAKSNPGQSEEALKQQVMHFLISARWIEGEAQRQGITVDARQIDLAYQKQSRSAFKSKQQKRNFLSRSGMQQQQLLFRAKLNLLASRLREEAARQTPSISQQEIADFYEKNQQRFGEAASRDVLIIRTKDIPRALIARRRILEGESFGKIANLYSDDEGSRAHGGRLRVAEDGFLNKPLEDAIFAAKAGKLVGPVRSDTPRSQRGERSYYLFRVLRDNPSARQPLSTVRPVITQLIASQKKRQQIASFLDRLEKQWKPRTLCLEGYVIDSCSNYSG